MPGFVVVSALTWYQGRALMLDVNSATPSYPAIKGWGLRSANLLAHLLTSFSVTAGGSKSKQLHGAHISSKVPKSHKPQATSHKLLLAEKKLELSLIHI